MKLLQVRNATVLLTLGEHRLLVDPMLSEVGAMSGFKFFGGGRRNNPLVPLPPASGEALETVTGVILTHEHPDHLDGPGLRWIKERKLPVWTNGVDAPNLVRKGLGGRVHIPDDGEELSFARTAASAHAPPRPAAGERPGVQKWLTAPFAGTW